MPDWTFLVTLGLAVAYANPAIGSAAGEMVVEDGVNLQGEAVVGEDGRFSVSLTLPLAGPDGEALPFDLTTMVGGSWTAGEATVRAVPDSAARTVNGLPPDHPDFVPTVASLWEAEGCSQSEALLLAGGLAARLQAEPEIELQPIKGTCSEDGTLTLFFPGDGGQLEALRRRVPGCGSRPRRNGFVTRGSRRGLSPATTPCAP